MDKNKNILQVNTDDCKDEFDYNNIHSQNRKLQDNLEKKPTIESLSSNASSENEIFPKTALFIFQEDNKFRKMIQKIILKKKFVMALNIIIVVNSLFLVFETIDNLRFVNDYTNILFTIIFTIEMIMKIIAYGFCLDENTYLRDPWNWLDFIIVLTGLISISPDYSTNLLALRTFRLIRPLKTISMLPNMRVFISTLINSLIDLSTVFLLMLFFFFIFAILGLSIWTDRFDYLCRESLNPIEGNLYANEKFSNLLCGGENTCDNNLKYCLSSKKFYYNSSIFMNPEYDIDLETDSKYFNYGYTNFNNIANALYVVFQTTTSEGWSNIMYMLMDGHNYYIAFIFFILCIIVNYFFLMNLLVAILLYNFEKNRSWDDPRRNLQMPNKKERNVRKDALTDKKVKIFNNLLNEESSLKKYRRKYIPLKMSETNKAADVKNLTSILHRFTKTQFFEHVKRTQEYHINFSFGYYVYYLYKQPILQYFFYTCIIINSITLCFNRDDETELEILNLERLNIFMVSVFALETFMLLIGIGFFKFVRNLMNIWDLIIVLISLVEIIILKNVLEGRSSSFSIASIFRLLRILRIFKLIRSWENFQVIISSIKETLLRMADFFLLFALFLFIFTLIGCSFFKDALKFDPITDKYSMNATSNIYNFDDFFSSLVSVFQILIGDQWHKMFFDCLRSPKTSNAESIFFFILIVLVGQITMMKIFLAYLIDNFERARKYLHKNIKVKKFIENLIYFTSKQHELEIINYSKTKDSEASVFNYYLQKLQNKKLLSEGRFIISAKSELDFFLFKKKKSEFYEKLDEKSNKFERIIFFDKLFFNDKKNLNLDELDRIDFHEFDLYYEKTLEENEKIMKLFNKENNENDNKENVEDNNQISEEKTFMNPNKSGQLIANLFKRTRTSILIKGNEKIDDDNNKEILNLLFSNVEAFKTVTDNMINKSKKSINQKNNKSSNNFRLHQTKTLVIELSKKKIEKLQSDASSNQGLNFIENINEINNSQDNKKLQSENSKYNIVLNRRKTSEVISLEKTKTLESFKPEKRKNIILNIKKEKIKNEEKTINLTNVKNCMNSFIDYIGSSSLFIFHKDSNFRLKIKSIIEHKIFDFIIAGIIIANSITLCLDTPWNDPEGILSQILNYTNYFFSSIFIIEAIMKIIAYGFLFRSKEKFKFVNSMNTKNFLKEAEVYLKNKMNISQFENMDTEDKLYVVKRTIKKIEKEKAYLREISNIVDFFVVIIGFIDMLGIQSVRYLRTLRALRSLRPIRIITKNENLKLIVTCLIKSIPAMANVFLVCAIFIFIYALLGVDLFKKDMNYFCSKNNYFTIEECLTNDGNWIYNQDNFSNFLFALKTLFNLMMAQGWGHIMNISAQTMQSKWTYLYFISYIIIGYLFILNLFVSIVVEKFKTLRNQENQLSQLSDEEKEWIKIQKIMLKFRPIPKFKIDDKDRIKKILYEFVISKNFENLTIISILLSMIFLIIQHNNSDETYNYILDGGNYFFTFIFNLEIILKLIVYGKIFFQNGWNNLDFGVIILCDIMVVLNILAYKDLIEVQNLTSLPIILRTFRFLRVIRLLTVYSKLRAMIDTLIYLVPSIMNIGMVLFILILIYGCIGMNLFGTVPYRENIHHNNNFRNFLSSSLLLFRVTTGEDWNLIMNEVAYHDCTNLTNEFSQRDYYCINFNQTCYNDDFVNFTSLQNNIYSCGSDISYFYFISFMIIGPIFILNLCVVTVIEGFSESMYENEGMLSQDYMDRFVQVWLNYDPDCTKLIRPHEFVLILKQLHPPIGFNYDRHYIFNPMMSYNYRKKLIVFRNLIKNEKDFQINLNKLNKFKHLENGYEFKNFYLSLDKKFYTTDLEVLKLTQKFKFTAIEKPNVKIAYSYTFNNPNYEHNNNENIHTDNIEKCLYVHFVDACLGLSRLMVSKKNNISYEKLRENVVGNFTKKMWSSKFSGDNLENYFGENKNKNKLSERWGVKMLSKVKILLTNKLKKVREKIELRKKNENNLENLNKLEINKITENNLSFDNDKSNSFDNYRNNNMITHSRKSSKKSVFSNENHIKTLLNSSKSSINTSVNKTILFQDDKEKIQKFHKENKIDKNVIKKFANDLFYNIDEVHENVEHDDPIPDLDDDLFNGRDFVVKK